LGRRLRLIPVKKQKRIAPPKLLHRLLGNLPVQEAQPKGVFKSYPSCLLYAALIGGAARLRRDEPLRDLLLSAAAYEAGFEQPHELSSFEPRSPAQSEVPITPRIERRIRGILVYPHGAGESCSRRKSLWLCAVMRGWPSCFMREKSSIWSVCAKLSEIAMVGIQPDDEDEEVFAVIQRESAIAAAVGAASTAAAVLNSRARQALSKEAEPQSLFDVLERLQDELSGEPADATLRWYRGVLRAYSAYLSTSIFANLYAQGFKTVPRPDWTVFDELASTSTQMMLVALNVIVSCGASADPYDQLCSSLKESVHLGLDSSLNVESVLPHVPANVLRELS